MKLRFVLIGQEIGDNLLATLQVSHIKNKKNNNK